jgi:hypothetical protein
MTVEMIASAIMNHIYSGTAGLNSNMKISLEQLMDEVIAERNIILKEYLLKGIMNFQEMFLSINCVEVNCDYMSKCCELPVGEKALHFEIPPIMYINGVNTIKFIGSIDRKVKYTVYTDDSYRYHQYKKRGANKPYVYVDTSVNANGNLDCYIFNLPMVKYISVVALFQDPRRLLEWDCCSNSEESILDLGLVSDEIIKRLTEKYIR